jgi:type II secretory pathway pseudopilin PulG
VTVLSLALPVAFSLLVMHRTEAERGAEATKVEWVAARVQEQAQLLEAKQAPTYPLDALRVRSIHASGLHGCSLSVTCNSQNRGSGF